MGYGHDDVCDDIAAVNHAILLHDESLRADTLPGGVCETCPDEAQEAMNRIASYIDALEAKATPSTPELIYLAAPYRGKTGSVPEVRENVAVAKIHSVQLVRAGHYVVCPHLSYHIDCILQYVGTTIPDSYWLAATMEMMRRCDRVVFVPGESQGVEAELAEARRLGIPVCDFDTFMTGGAECDTP